MSNGMSERKKKKWLTVITKGLSEVIFKQRETALHRTEYELCKPRERPMERCSDNARTEAQL